MTLGFNQWSNKENANSASFHFFAFSTPQKLASPCTAALFVGIFHSFEAEIANAISCFKRMKNNIICEK